MKLKLEIDQYGCLRYYCVGNILIAFPHRNECEEYAKTLFETNKIAGSPRIVTVSAQVGTPQYINWEATKANNYEITYYTDEEIDEAIRSI